MVWVNDIVAHLQLVQLFESDHCLAAFGILRAEADTVVTLKNLMVGIARYMHVAVYKTFMQCMVYRRKAYLYIRSLSKAFKNSCQAVGLFLLVGKYI